jgi:hypothetical protein
VADGTWWYATERAAFYCGAKLKLERDGKCVVVDVQDNGPADWVESNSASKCGTGYIIDTSPLVADYFGGGCGWGECFIVDVSQVPDGTPTGPCTTTPQNCAQSQADACGYYGCHCADNNCSGGFCPGNGCTAQDVANCGAYGCNCVDGQCNGGFCPGSGCTAKEANDCAAYGCGCVDHQCSGGFCEGTGCTAKETTDCAAYGCGCIDHQCNGVFCDGSGCTAKQTLDCEAIGRTCHDGVCEPPEGNDAGAGGAAGSTGPATGGAAGSEASAGAGNVRLPSTGGSAERGSAVTDDAGCHIGRNGSKLDASLLALLVGLVLSRKALTRIKSREMLRE